MGSPLRPTLPNTFLCFYKKKLEQSPKEFKPLYQRQYVYDILYYLGRVIFYLNLGIIEKNAIQYCNFLLKRKKNGKLSFLDVDVSREGNKFVMVNHTYFDSVLPSTSKFGMICTLDLYLVLCFDWSKFQTMANLFSYKKK